MTSDASLPLPLDPSPPPEADEKRLWIGNLDSRLTEYHLIKVLQKHGKVTKFDYLFHKSGPLKGQPRGYAFVTYETRSEAENVIAVLNGKMLLKKTILVKWAHTVPMDDPCPKKSVQQGMSTNSQSTKNIYSQINAIEAKLKAMDDQSEKDLELCLAADAPVTNFRTNPLLAQKHTVHIHRQTATSRNHHHKNYISRATKRRC